MKRFSKPFYLLLGWFCVGLGIVGVVLPVVPTTPFLIVALWAFTRSSPKLAARLRSHPTFGPYLRDWQDHGVIPTRAKILALITMSSSIILMTMFSPLPFIALILMAALMSSIAIYIVSRPGNPPQH